MREPTTPPELLARHLLEPWEIEQIDKQVIAVPDALTPADLAFTAPRSPCFQPTTPPELFATLPQDDSPCDDDCCVIEEDVLPQLIPGPKTPPAIAMLPCPATPEGPPPRTLGGWWAP